MLRIALPVSLVDAIAFLASLVGFAEVSGHQCLDTFSMLATSPTTYWYALSMHGTRLSPHLGPHKRTTGTAAFISLSLPFTAPHVRMAHVDPTHLPAGRPPWLQGALRPYACHHLLQPHRVVSVGVIAGLRIRRLRCYRISLHR